MRILVKNERQKLQDMRSRWDESTAKKMNGWFWAKLTSIKQEVESGKWEMGNEERSMKSVVNQSVSL